MLDEFGRGGRLAGAGFYDYADGKRTRPVGRASGTRSRLSRIPRASRCKDLEERMLFIESIESVKCMDEGVIESVADANIGSIMGIGFPGWTGGVLQYINGYEGGLPVSWPAPASSPRTYGERFEPPASLVEKAERGENYSDEPDARRRPPRPPGATGPVAWARPARSLAACAQGGSRARIAAWAAATRAIGTR